MTLLSKGALVLALAASTGLFSDGGTVKASEVESVVSEAEAIQPFDLYYDGTKSLLVSYADETGRDNVAKHANKKNMKVKKTTEFKNKHTLNPGNKGGGGGGGNDSKGNDKGNSKNKGRTRNLIEENAVTAGFSVLELDVENLEAEMAELMAIEGVTAVEEDATMHIESMEYQQKLRGGGVAGHVREIQDAIKAAASQFPGEEIEFSPNLESEEVLVFHPERRLAEGTPYGINMVNVTHLWSKMPASNITICVVDTGYDLGHQDLPDATGWHQVNTDGSTPFGKWDVDGHGHGTHCAGTIGAIGGNDLGVVGVNPDPSKFNFVIGKGLSDSGSGSTSNVMEAVLQCVNAGAKVVSMSLGGTGSSATVQAFYEDQYDKDVLIIAAAGNSGADSWGYPAGYPPVMSVGSVMESGTASGFTTRNTQVEISAPGHYVQSTYKGNAYTTMSGTSMACPHVAGVAALLWSHFPDCTNNQIRNAMINSVVDPPASTINVAGWDKYYGWGTVNAGLAYELLSKGCEVAGGATNPPENEGLSYFATGGKDQKNLGCTMDEHCAQFNPCLGEHVCNAGTCVQVQGTAPVCDDGLKCTIDTCDPSRPLNDLCVYTPKPCEDGNKCNGIMACDEATGSCFEQAPVVNCDDNNACTVDSCNTSTGVCSNVPKTCDDNNACTLNDGRCDPNVGCIFSNPIPNCCGNAECDADETESSCPADCGTSLTTSFDASLAQYSTLGPIFDIATKSKNVTIVGFDLNCVVPDGLNAKVFVYSLAGGHYFDNGNWYSRSRWELVANPTINCNGLGVPTTVTFDKQVHVGKNSRHAFNAYIYTDESATGYWFSKAIYPPSGKTARYSVVEEDSYLQIMTGSHNRCISGFCAISSPYYPSITINYGVVNDSPTGSPTITAMPTTPFPTAAPTTGPTPAPTNSPTESPTNSPTVSLAPTPFEPIKVTVATPPTNSASTVNAFYFDVAGGVNDSVITNMKVTTYAPSQTIKVFAKRGNAAGSEAIPCDWQLVAETGNESTGYWKTIYPKWINGFKPVELFAGETVSFYVQTDQRLLGQSASSSLKYTNYMTTDSTHVLPGTGISYAATGTNNLFEAHPSYYSARSLMGALDFETVAPGSTMSPTSAPTAKFSSYQIESTDPTSESTFHGIQFDVKSTENIVLRGLSMYVETGTHFMEVWYRVGSHKGSSSGCDHHNNWCNQWIKAAAADITSTGKEALTNSPPLSIIVSPGQTIGIAVTLPKSLLVAGTSSFVAEGDTDGRVIVFFSGSQINDYYGDEVNTIHALEPAPVAFKGVIDYDVSNSFCATISAQNGVLSDFGPDEPEEVTNPNGPEGDGGPEQDPMDESVGDGYDSLS